MQKIYANADHPQTCLNPDPYFLVKDMEARDGKLYLRGENTMWFHVGLLTFYSEETALELIREFEDLKQLKG